MKKILFILPTLSMGGLEKSLVSLVNSLASVGYDVTVMIWRKKLDLKDELDERVRVIYRAPDMHLGNKIPFIRYKFYDDDMWERRANARQFYRYYVGGEKYDVEIAYLHDYKTLKILLGANKKQGKRIAWIHFDFSKDEDILAGIESGERSREELFHSFASLDYVICVSRQAADAFRQTIGDTGNIRVIYNLLPVEEIKRKAEEELPVHIIPAKLKILTVCRLVDRIKGLTRLIHAVSFLRDEGADIALTMVGAGEDEEEIRKCIADCGVEDCVSLVGQQLNPYPLIKEADLLVCSSYEEGYNLTVAEALILEKPVLSTDCTGPNEILDYGKYGFVVENSDEGLYMGLRYLYDNPWMLDYYGKTAQKRLEFFDEKRILKEVTDLF